MRATIESLSIHWWVVVALVAVTITSWLGRLHPVLELLPNARSQLLILTVVAALGLAVTGGAKPAVVAALVVVAHGVHLAPYAFASPDPISVGAIPVRAMQYNIFYGNENLDAVAASVIESDADVVALHELLPDAWTVLDDLLAETYPYRYAVPFDEHEGQLSGGMALLSKTPLAPIEVDARYSPPERVLLAATTEVADREIMIIGLHPHASRFESRKVSLRSTQIAGVVDLVEGTDMPVVLLADMNVTPTSPVYQDLLNELGWSDPHRASGWATTWPTWGGPLGFPIDHVLVSEHFAVHGARTGDGAGSDHRSLVAEISLRP